MSKPHENEREDGDGDAVERGVGETQEIARAAQRGDGRKFAELYERVAPALYTWASLRIRPAMRGMIDPEDVVQEVWCRAWKAFGRWDAEATSFRMWVFRIAKNVLLEGFRKVQRSGGMAAGPSTRLFQMQNVPDSASAVSGRVARDEGIKVLLGWVEGLSVEEKQLFVHCGLEGLTYAEVGERMKLERDTVAKRWQVLRARVVQFAVPRDLVAAG